MTKRCHARVLEESRAACRVWRLCCIGLCALAACGRATQQFGLYESCDDSACGSCQNNTLYIGRCVYQPEINACLQYACNDTMLFEQMYEGQSTCAGTPQVTPIELNTCLPGPFDNSLKYYCTSKPIPPPPAPLYGQAISCSSFVRCNSTECDYNWFTPNVCTPTFAGSTLQACNDTSYTLSTFGSSDCSGAPSAQQSFPLFSCVPGPVPGQVQEYQVRTTMLGSGLRLCSSLRVWLSMLLAVRKVTAATSGLGWKRLRPVVPCTPVTQRGMC